MRRRLTGVAKLQPPRPQPRRSHSGCGRPSTDTRPFPGIDHLGGSRERPPAHAQSAHHITAQGPLRSARERLPVELQEQVDVDEAQNGPNWCGHRPAGRVADDLWVAHLDQPAPNLKGAAALGKDVADPLGVLPVVSARTKPPPDRLKAFTGVRYSRPVIRPWCTTIAKPGRRPAKVRVIGLVTRRLKRPSDGGRGMRLGPAAVDLAKTT